MTQEDDKDSIHFSESVASGSTVKLTKEMERDATVEEIVVRVYRGSEFALRVTPFKDVEPGDSERRVPLVTFRGRDYLAGDADVFRLPISRDIQKGETLGIEAENTAGSFSYDFNASYIVDYAGGSNRVVSLLGRFL